MSITIYTDLLSGLAACSNDKQVVKLLEEKSEVVDDMLLRFFEDPTFNWQTAMLMGAADKMQGIQFRVRQQYSRNLIFQYVNLPEDEEEEAFIQKYKLVLLQEYSYNCLFRLINSSEQNLQREWLIGKLHLLVNAGISFLLSLDDALRVEQTIVEGPSYFTNPLAMQILQSMWDNNGLKFESIDLIHAITQYKNRFPEDAIKQPVVKDLFGKYSQASDVEDKIDLLQQVMSKIKKESQVVAAHVRVHLGTAYFERLHGIRSANLEAAISHFNSALLFFTKEQSPYYWASVQNGLARCYALYQKGDAGNNIEKSIEFLQNSLESFTKQEAPYDWAMAQNNLGAAYLERVKGNKAENIQTAINCFTHALTIQTFAFTPADWAMTMSNLGDAYNNKHATNRTTTAKKAIECYNNALTVYTQDDFPVDWAKTQTKISNAYLTLAVHSPAENLEKALEYATLSLRVLTSRNAPNEWAYTQHTLGSIYMERIQGERIENLELAIEHFTQVFSIDTREQAPYSWAINHLNLGNCYRQRLRGNAQDNQEKALHHLQQTLQVLDQSRFAIDWASVQHVMGIIYDGRVTGDKADNYENAIACFQQALQVRTPDNVMSSWIETMNSLGNAYKNRSLGEKTDNQNKAIACFAEIEKYIDPSENAHVWAIVQYNTGLVYMQKKDGMPTQNKTSAIRFFQHALTIHTPTANPIECFKVAINLGKLHFADNNYSEAQKAFELCHQSIENMRTQSTRENTRKQLAAECSNMYEMLVYACLSMKDTDSAFYYTSAAKARVFSDKLGALAEKPSKILQSNPAFAESWQFVSSLRQKIDELVGQREFFYTRGTYIGKDGNSLAATLEVKQEELSRLLDDLYFRFPELSLTTDAPIADPGKIKELSKVLGNIPLVEYYQHQVGWGAFVIYNGSIQYVDLPGVSDELISAIKQCVLDYENGVLAGNKPDAYTNSLSTHLVNLYRFVIDPLRSILPVDGPLVIAPAGDLHLLPFNVAYDVEKKKYLTDAYTITYIPSLAALYTLYRRLGAKQPAPGNNALLSVMYSAENTGLPLLSYAKQEAKIIAGYFLPSPSSVYLYEQDATPQRVIEACGQKPFNTIHFSCHGYFNFDDPENLGLVLCGGLLTVERIQTELRLSNHPVVLLSACQTGRSRPSAGDDAVGLIQSFFGAGAGLIVSSQWSVDDRSTKELFKVFYEKCKTMKITEALREAMIAIRREQNWYHPIYWAAFKITGLPN